MKVGVIANNQTEIFQRLLIAGVREIAEERGHTLKIHAVNEAGAPEKPTDVDGLLVIANPVPDDFLEEVYQQGLPISLISHEVPGLPIPTLMFNHAQGIELLTRHLVVGCGRRQLVFVRGISEQRDAQQREAAFRREIMRYQLDVPEHLFIRGDFDPDIAADSMKKFLASQEPFDGVLAADYVMAAAAVQVLQEYGIQVPRDVSVVGFGDAPEAMVAGITTVAADVQELGRRAARQLLSQMNGLRIRGITTLSVALVVRNT
jgi:LacI family transcriptional regulator